MKKYSNIIYNKYKNLPQSTKASLWYIISNIILKGISFITLPLFTRLLSTEEYGVLSIYQSWIVLISILTTLTIWGGVFNVVMVKQRDKQNEIVSSFQGLACSITFIFLCLSIIFNNYISAWLGLSNLLTILIFMEILVQIPYNLWSSKQRFLYKYKKMVIITIVIGVLNPLIGYIAVISTEYKVEARIITSLILYVILGIILFIFNMNKSKKFYSYKLWKYAVIFNVPLIPHYLSTQILNQSDRLMINYMCGSSEAGIYSVAYNFAMILNLVISGINSSFTPFIYKNLNEKKYDEIKEYTNIVVLIVALLTIGFICFVPDIFFFLLPESYYPAIPVIPSVIAGVFFMFLYPLFGSIEFYFENNNFISIASIVGASLNIILNYIFIPIIGFIFAAYSTLICFVIFTLMHYYFTRRLLYSKGENIPYDIKYLFKISIIVLLTMGFIQCFYNNMFIRWNIILILVLILIYYKNDTILKLKSLFIKKRK